MRNSNINKYLFSNVKRPDNQVIVCDNVSIDALDESGRPSRLDVKVLRIQDFPAAGERWLFGKLLNGKTLDAQVKIRINRNDPENDSIELFPYAQVHV